jgi:LuxR family maltose regulon positive regulatory protein
MSEIRNSDLVFDAPAASALLTQHGLALSTADVRTLVERTEGWAAGLRLCALAMQRTDDPAAFVQQFSTDRTTIADYLLTEVLDTQPEASRDLLLRVSVLPRVTPDLANTLTGRDDAAWILTSLERANAFVEPLGTTGWYRLHPLFTEVLRAHLRQRMPGVEAELHRRAARWLAAAGHGADAVDQAAKAGDWAYAADIIVDDLAVGSLLAGPDALRLRGIFAAMPAGVPGTAPALVTAALRLADGDGDGCTTALLQADVSLTEEGPTATRKAFCRAFLGTLCSAPAGGVLDAATADGTSIRPPRPGSLPSLPVRTPEFRALLLTVLGTGLLTEGRLQRSATALRLANAASARHASGGTWGLSLERLALVELIHGDLGLAEVHARTAAEALERSGPSSGNRTGLSSLVLAAVAASRHDIVSARVFLATANACPGTRYEPVAAMEAAVTGAQLELACGNSERALEVVRTAAGPGQPGHGTGWIASKLAIAESAVHLARRNPAAAVAVLVAEKGGGTEREVAMARALIATGQGSLATDILTRVPLAPLDGAMTRSQARLVRAQAAARRHDGHDAGRRLCQALQQTPPQEIALLCDAADVRPPPSARAVTRELSRRRAPAERPVGQPPQPLPAVVEPLSEREREVLRQAAQLQSNAEIAAELHVSVNTVKSHLKSVHRKLCVSRRRDAVRRARQLKLV